MLMSRVIMCCSVCCIPDKLFADRAESRLREERGTELVAFDNVNFGLFDGTSPLVQGEQVLSLPLRLWFSVRLSCSI